MHTKTEYLEIVIPYRMKAIDIFRVALKYELSWQEPKKMQIYFEQKLCIDGLSTGWTNPVIESGIMHCRACLEFLGIKEDPKTLFKLKTRGKKRQDNYGIEDWGLSPLTVQEVVDPYEGSKDEAEKALASVIHCANKGIAHPTASLIIEEGDRNLYEIASRGIPTLLINHFYTPLGLQPPDYKIKSNLP